MKEEYIIDGNEACAKAAYLFSEVCGIYPITPASPMATLVDKWSSSGKENLYKEQVKVVEMQSEAGASALVHGSLQAGSLTTTFTASQGLLLMIPTMYKIAGELLPCVIHVAARSLATHALSIFGDHQDIYATRSTGFCMLASSTVEDAYYMAIIAHLSSIEGSLPFLHFFDGFRTSHELNKVSLLKESEVLKLINYKYIDNFKKRSLNIGKSITRGTSQTGDIYFQNTEIRNNYYLNMPHIVSNNMERLNKLALTTYKPFNYYGCKNATHIIIAMGSVCSTIKTVVDILNKKGMKTGLVEVHLYRPFSSEYLLNIIPKSTQAISVLDRTKEFGSSGCPLYLDVIESLKHKNIEMYAGIYGLSSKNVSLDDINAVFENMINDNPKQKFTLGINDDVTHLSLSPISIEYNPDYREIKVFGFGSDGMVGASKNLMKVLGEKDSYVQGYFEYDSKKSGGITVSHLRIGPNKIEAPYYVMNPDFVVVSKDTYLSNLFCLENIKENGTLLLSSTLNDAELNNLMSLENKKEIINKHIKVYISNLNELNKKYSLNGKINNLMCMYMMKILECNNNDIDDFKSLIKKTYANKGQNVIDNNINAIDESLKYLEEVDNNIFTVDNKVYSSGKDIIKCIKDRMGNTLSVSDFINHEDGSFDGGNSKNEKQKNSIMVPHWDKSNCIECNQCSFVCPHACIRPFSLTDNELIESHIDKSETIESIGERNKNFYMSISESNCTGCGLCIKACPGKNGTKALSEGEYNSRFDNISEYLFNNQNNDTPFNKFTVKGSAFQKPYFEFSGACAGCGEAAYIKVLTLLYGKNIVIANATGCSSIYGGSLPITPYKIPWMNSLFEDNAEFGLGLYYSYNNNRKRIKDIMHETKDIVSLEVKNLFKEWTLNSEDDDLTYAIKDRLESENLPNDLKLLLDYIPSRKVWIIGGDGWAYDIGYGGVDHVLHSNEDVKIMVLDTEVYSNTGGQKSKSTKVGSVAEFASSGKHENKKDLFKIAMSIPNVYVASISLGANMNQTIKALKEAYEHKGPSLIIAYSPCIEQGIYGGLNSSLDEQKLLVDVGYNILMRYNPENDELIIDSKEPDFTTYDTVFRRELRYKNLETKNEIEYKELYERNINCAKERYEYFKSLEKKED